VPLNLLVKINDIPDPDRISVGDAIFIPGAESRLHVEPYYAYAGALPALPVNGTITSPFGAQRRGYLHTGLDISAPAGTPIRAALPGVVSFSGKQRRYGKIVILEHANGYSSVYAHNHRNLVKTGDRVKKGQHIALVGRSGNATGFHLHFELHKDGRPVNPIDFIKAGK
jgi:murein DD-endopeptidase MepM/ murein hydrolase activator NlpD